MSDRKDYTILCVDDEPDIVSSLYDTFMKIYNVKTATSGEEALKIFSRQNIDIVILDVRMPEKGGLSVLHEINKMSHEGDCGVIIMTAYSDETAATEALRAGAIGFEKKPIEKKHLIFSVERALDKLITKRALLYKTRETELAWKFIAKISTKKEIEIDFRNMSTQILFKEFFLNFTNKLELCSCIFDLKMNVILSNKHMDKVMKEPPVKAGENFFEKLEAIGVTGLSQAEFLEITNEIIESGKGFTKTISTGKYSSVFFGRISLLTMEGRKTGILFMVRGERY